MTKEFFSTIRCTREEIARIISAATGFLEHHALPPRSLYSVNLVLEEILTNIVKHGCLEDSAHEIHVRIELKDASDFRPGQRGAWMRLRFARSGHSASKIEVKEETVEAKASTAETIAPVSETTGPAETTNGETRIKAATGN